MRHSQLIMIGIHLGYSLSQRGLCKGFSSMWIQAVCSGEEKSFMQRLKLLEQYADIPEKLAQDIINVKKLLVKDEQRAKEDPKYHQKTFNELTDAQKALLEVPVFYEGMALYLSPQSKEVFNKFLRQFHEVEISEYVQSEALEELGGLERAFHTNDQYKLTELTKYLQKISQKLQGISDVAIEFGANGHAINVRVIGPNRFQMIDTNHLDEINKIYTSEELANELNSYFSNSSFLDWFREPTPIVMTTSVFTHQKNPLDLTGLKKTEPIQALVANKSSPTLLHIAAERNDVDTLRRMDFSTIDVNLPGQANGTALALAAISSSNEAAEFLLTIPSIDVNKPEIFGPIFHAIWVKNYELAYKIAEHPSFNIKNNTIELGNVLHVIAATKNPPPEIVEFAQYLIDKGADINQQNKEGNTPLYEACINGNKQLAKLFLKNNARLDLLNAKNFSVLHAAACSGNIELVQLFLEKGLDCNQLSTSLETPLHSACVNGQFEVVALLLKYGANFNQQTTSKETPLHFACANGNKEVVGLLLNRGADCNQLANSITPFHIACMKGHKALVEMLLESGADCNLRTKEGLRPLDLICKHNHLELLPTLLTHTELTSDDIKSNAPLAKLISSYDCNVQTDFLKKALTIYIRKREGQAEYGNILNLGVPKSQKIAAAKALLANLNGDEQGLKFYQSALNDGELSFLYGLYKVLPKLQIAPESAQPKRSYTKILGLFGEMDSSSPAPIEPKSPRPLDSSSDSEVIRLLEESDDDSSINSLPNSFKTTPF